MKSKETQFVNDLLLKQLKNINDAFNFEAKDTFFTAISIRNVTI
jgi:hypothetical protein